ncbi:MAG TPA: glycosyltransferase family 2 protein [Anaerolineae bacterium]|nr:glycosyltransferase family 2 protein [Anaerolineae bacterium]
MSGVRVSVVIPHWNGRHHLDVCLTALRRQTFRDFEVILADNGSEDGSQAYVRAEFPEVRLVELGANLGFTGACNAGYEAARGELIVLLNNDTEVASDWLGEMVAAFDADEGIGVVACKILLFDRREHFHTAGDYVGLDGIPGNRGVWQRDEGQYDEAEDVFGACAGAAGYRREMVAEIGFLDDAFFFSCEDVDLSWRAQLAGWRVRYVPTAVVYHKLKASGGDGSLSSYYDGRNSLYVLWKNYPGSLWRKHWRLVVGAQWRLAREALGAWRGKAARARLKGQLVGLVSGVWLWPRRRVVQGMRRVDDEHLEKLMGDERR